MKHLLSKIVNQIKESSNWDVFTDVRLCCGAPLIVPRKLIDLHWETCPSCRQAVPTIPTG